MGKEVAFRADAAFAKPEIYDALEERGVKYAIRIPANENLQRDIEELLMASARSNQCRGQRERSSAFLAYPPLRFAGPFRSFPDWGAWGSARRFRSDHLDVLREHLQALGHGLDGLPVSAINNLLEQAPQAIFFLRPGERAALDDPDFGSPGARGRPRTSLEILWGFRLLQSNYGKGWEADALATVIGQVRVRRERTEFFPDFLARLLNPNLPVFYRAFRLPKLLRQPLLSPSKLLSQ